MSNLGERLFAAGMRTTVAKGRTLGARNLSGSFNPQGRYTERDPRTGLDSRYGIDLSASQGPVGGGDASTTQTLVDAKHLEWPGGGLIPDDYDVSAGDSWPASHDRLDMLYVAFQGGISVWSSAAKWVQDRSGPGPDPPDPVVINPDPVRPVHALLHGNRFKVSVERRHEGTSTPAITYQPPLTPGDTTCDFYFFDPSNREVVLKILGPVDGWWWVILASLSSLEFAVAIEDARTGAVWRYRNPADTFASHADFRALQDVL